MQTETQSEPDAEPEEAMASCVTPFRNDQDPETEPEPEPDPDPEPNVPPATPLRDEQEEASIQLMHWLRGVRDFQPTPGMSDENASVCKYT